jgi:preprotein translocase subunit SecB
MSYNTETASFSFKNHKVRKFSFNEPTESNTNIMIDFNPSGEYNLKEGVFKIILEFTAKYGSYEKKVLCEIIADGYFNFEENTPLEKIPDFFYSNGIAILFPYLRAFITTLTAVANVKPLVLPTLNLNSLAKPLKENTVVI